MKRIFVSILLTLMFLLNMSGDVKTQESKNYVLVVDVLNYNSNFRKAVKFFFSDVLKKGDNLFLLTPKRLYNLSKYSVVGLSEKITDKTISVLKKDIEAGAYLWKRTTNKRSLKDIKDLYQQKILNCSKIFTKLKGENHLIMMYQIRYAYDYDGTQQKYSIAIKVGDQYEMSFDKEKVLNSLKENKTKFHFLYYDLKKGNPNAVNSADVFSNYSKLAKESDGIKLTSKKPISFFKKLKKLK